ncbi:MAG TPA: nucleoside diphosphate kinase regulator [Thermoanaerobaculales bacterium]|nr:nucleoside diphosphate kinase regulator [Thermoanaerobaculales bacterium]HPA79677.1 nucleoside diphosphate kinase regulator [Thermoanaerobaculales bacterium]
MKKPEIIVTSADAERLREMLDRHSDGRDQEAVKLLEAELARARVVPPEEIPADVVTMNSRLGYFVETTGVERVVTLVYPGDSDFRAARESVLAPVGCAVLGLAVGQVIDWPRPHDGLMLKIAVTEIQYQPEAAGDYHL